MHKTGTTSIQRCLNKNRRLLFERGLAYLKAPEPNHSLSMLSAFEPDAERVHGKHFRRSSDQAQYLDNTAGLRHDILRQFELAVNRGANFLISGEAIYHLSERGLLDLREELGSRFEDIFVVGLVRAPLLFADSYAHEQLKIGMTYRQMIHRPPLPRYRERFGKFEDIFSPQNMRMSLYPEQSASQDPLALLGGLLHEVSDDVFHGLRVERENVALSKVAAKCLSALNQEKRISYDDIQKIVLPALRMVGGEKARVPQEVLDEVISRSKEDCDWISNRLATPLDLTDNCNKWRDPLSSYIEFSDLEVGEIVSQLGLNMVRVLKGSERD